MNALTVVYLQSTKNVLAALTRAAPPGASEPVKALVGTGLPVRAVGSTPTHLVIPASALAVVTVNDTQPDAVLDPQAFQVVDDPLNKAVHEVTPLPLPAGTPPTITLTLTLKGAVVATTNVPPTATLQAVLQKVTTPPVAATVFAPRNLGPGPVTVTVAPATGFRAGETWDFTVFITAMPPQAISQTL